MAASRLRARPPRRFAWLFWLVLLLPLAQAVASWHAVSHLAPQQAGESSDGRGKPAPHPEHCALCVTAAPVHGGALPSLPVFVPPASAKYELSSLASAGVGSVAPARPYQSRAPPDASH